jgi:poly-gamma-glutamate capsule biosynthesis protein CapA/YwtB (metallophosphatase superfamily)
MRRVSRKQGRDAKHRDDGEEARRDDSRRRPDELVTMFLCGDVMTGRGVDQILPHPGDPQLWESLVRDAREYVALAEAANGPIPRPVEFAWPWGDALAVIEDMAADVRVLNLETSVTRSDDVAQDKAVNYRMSPDNIGCLSVARPDVCALANNHVLDFGYRGLDETRQALAAARILAVGAGRDLDEAQRSAIVPVPGRGRVVVFSLAAPCSGVPDDWAATTERAGVDLVPNLSAATADKVAARTRAATEAGDVVIVSIHWGSNWGYQMPADHIEFAHRLIDGGVDIVHGHSSHHPRPIEVYHARLILTGAATSSTTMRASAGMSSTATIYACCTSRQWKPPQAGWSGCRWRRCRHARCACTTPRSKTRSICGRSWTGSAGTSARNVTSAPTGCLSYGPDTDARGASHDRVALIPRSGHCRPAGRRERHHRPVALHQDR